MSKASMDPVLDFSEQRVLITGAASGFGALLARALAERGARLVLGDVQDAPLQALAQELTAAGHQVLAQPCDVSDEHQVRQLVAASTLAWDGLDLAVNNAGIGHPFTPTEAMDEGLFDRVMAVNTKGVLYGMKYQIPALRRAGQGAILNVSSMAGLGGASHLSAYVASKHAVVGLTRTAAVEQARHGIRVNAICPYYTHTPLVDELGGMAPEAREQAHARMASGTPMRRLGQPQEIIAVMLMILSPANTFMTGQAIAVDGGVSAY